MASAWYRTQTGEPSAEPTPDDRSTSFTPAEDKEIYSGTVLLTEAYAAIWILVFVMLVRSMRKQSRLDQRIEELRRDLVKARSEKQD